MPARSFPQVAQLTTPIYRDMGAGMDRAREQWSRMRQNMLSQQPATAPDVRVPSIPPAMPDYTQHERREVDAGDILLALAVIAVVLILARMLLSRVTERWRAIREQTR